LISGAASQTFVVVDEHGRVRYVSPDPGGENDLGRLLANAGTLQPEVEVFVRGIAEGNSPSPVRTTFLDDDYVLRAMRLVGAQGTMFVLSVERDRNRESLARAARRHLLTRRETSVLKLILDGLSCGEIAGALGISEHTVQGYFKRLLAKTGARNRVSMVAQILNWQPAIRAIQAEESVELAV